MADKRTLLKIQDLIAATGGRSLSTPAQILLGTFTSVATDSRNVCTGSVFFALFGSAQNGHSYIPHALEKGASVVFIAKSDYETNKQKYDNPQFRKNAVFIVVENTLTALQRAAAAYVRQFPQLIKIAVTGSSGKTTVKELLGAVLAQKFSVIINEGNLNSETGLPLAVFKIRDTHHAGIFEMGMNRRGEIAELASVLFPDIAVITNIGTAHIGILGTKDAIAEEKKSVFKHFSKTSAAFIPADDAYADFLARGIAGNVYHFGLNRNAQIDGVKNHALDGTEFTYKNVKIRLPLIGTHNYIDALAAIAVAEYMGLDAAHIKAGLESVKPLFGRSQVIRSDVTLIQDCYNANPESVASMIAFCADLEWKKRKVLVLGDMLELGADSEGMHKKIGMLAAHSGADLVVFFGEQSAYAAQVYAQAFPQKKLFHSTDIEKIKQEIASFIKKGDIVILKASKGMELWRAASAVIGERVESILRGAV